MIENKRFKIVDEEFISYYGGTGHKISNGECGFWLWHSKEESQKVCDRLNFIINENEQLKQELLDCKKDEKQLSISFMEFKMQLIEVLQQNYNYAYNQRQKNLNKSIVARNYEVLYQTIDNIAETMNVDIERFPKGER